MRRRRRRWLGTPRWREAAAAWLLVAVLGCCAAAAPRNAPVASPLSLAASLAPSALVDLAAGPVTIAGQLAPALAGPVRVRVTTGRGRTCEAEARVRGGAFALHYPADFPGAPPLVAGPLFIDASTAPDFAVDLGTGSPAEAMLLLYDSRRHLLPELPSAFTADLYDAAGHPDAGCAEWPVIRALVNLYMRSRAARLVGVGRPNFDLERPDDLAWFKHNLALYDFDQRDRDWSTPLGHRVRRTFWQSVWDTWFNASNDHPLGGAPAQYEPYAFSNDFSDILISTWLRRDVFEPLDDNLTSLCREATENLLAMQHRGATTFCLPDASGARHEYTAGAFHYGLFANGDWLTEGTGWFYDPNRRDYVHGGVFNGRCVWALGEALQDDPDGPLADRIKQAVALGVRYCWRDALAHGYAAPTGGGHVYWHDPSEQAYLLLGLLAACRVVPDLPLDLDPPRPLRQGCIDGLNALVDLCRPEHQWAVYPNTDSLAIAALAEGVALLHDEPDAARWRSTATAVADAWLAARPDPAEFSGEPIHFGLRPEPTRMTYNWGPLSGGSMPDHNTIYFYQTGHWIHALGDLYAVTGDMRYRARAEAMVRYLCGANPWGVRLFNELGGVYNWVEDTDGDGVEDWLKYDMYPESTAFCQIGIMRLMRVLAGG